MENSILAMLMEEMAVETPGSNVMDVTGLAPMSFAIKLAGKAGHASLFLVVCLDPNSPAIFSQNEPIPEFLAGTPAESLPQGFI